MEDDDKLYKALCPKDECTVCGTDVMEDEGWVQGYFGVLPVSFCVWCYSSMLDMVEKLTLPEDDQEGVDDT